MNAGEADSLLQPDNMWLMQARLESTRYAVKERGNRFICLRTGDGGLWKGEVVTAGICCRIENFINKIDKTVSVLFDRIKTKEFDEEHSNQDTPSSVPFRICSEMSQVSAGQSFAAACFFGISRLFNHH